MPYSPLSFQLRADLYSQLAVMEKAGLPRLQALGLLKLDQSIQSRLRAMCKLVAYDGDLSAAGEKCGMFTALEARLLNAAYATGQPEKMYARLSGYYAKRALQARQVKSRLALPGLVLLVALCVNPLPALVTGTLSAGSYLWQVLMPLFLLAAAAKLIKKLGNAQESEGVLKSTLDALLPQVPVLGPMHLRRNLRDYFESLALMLEAGIPMLEALPTATKAIYNRGIRRQFQAAAAEIRRGVPFAPALAGLHCLHGSSVLALAATGEASGSLPQMLLHYVNAETAALNQFQQQLSDWLPRIVYALIAGWVTYGLLNGPGVGPHLPADL